MKKRKRSTNAMNKQQLKYVSIFKIDGVPILPPLMTNVKRLQMQRYRDIAIQKERQFNEKQKNSLSNFPNEQNTILFQPDPNPNEIIINDHEETDYENEIRSEYLEMSSMIQLMEESNVPDSSVLNHPPIELEEVRKNTLTPPPNVDSSTNEQFFTPLTELNQQHDEVKVPKTEESLSSPINRPKLIRSNSYTLDEPSSLFLKHLENQYKTIPDSLAIDNIESAKIGVVVNTEQGINENVLPPKSISETKKKVHYIKPKLITGPTQKNSIKNGNNLTKKTSNSNNIVSPLPIKKKSSTVVQKLSNSSILTVRQIYDPKSCVPTKQKVNHQKTQLPTPSPVPLQNNQQPNNINNTSTNEKKLMDFIAKVESDRQIQMQELIKRQEAEQFKMQQEFMRQQEILIKQITENYVNVLVNNQQQHNINQQQLPQQQIGPDNDDIDLVVPSIIISKTNLINQLIDDDQSAPTATVSSTIMSSCIGDLEQSFCSSTISKYDCNADHSFSNNYAVDLSPLKSPREFSSPKWKLSDNQQNKFIDNNTKSKAATIINAYARGYLVRRLLHTDEVQSVVKIIHDTVIFIIDLHKENIQNSAKYPNYQHSDADIKLKRSLLNQLNAACYSLHEIFFNKTILQKMEIISIDRRIKQEKLKIYRDNQKRYAPATSNTITESFSNLNQVESQNSLTKLSKLKLFTINISAIETNKLIVNSYELNKNGFKTRPKSA